MKNIYKIIKNSSKLGELTGAFGDIGTFIPIFVCLVAFCGINATATLIIAGLSYIACGIYYKIPMPVQPLKALAAISISLKLTSQVISAAGIIIGAVLLFLALTKLTVFLPKLFNRVIIKGMQLGVGLILIKTSWMLIVKPYSSPVLAVANGMLPQLEDFKKALIFLVIPQLPLTLSNAIVGTRDVARKFFKEKANKVTERPLSFGLGLVNIAGGFLGCMPLCHGSSGITAHYVFGARTGLATIITGLACLVCAFLFGERSGIIFKAIPHQILGVMLFFVGFQHAFLVRELYKQKGFWLALSMGIVSLLSGNLIYGLFVGFFVYYFPKLKMR